MTRPAYLVVGAGPSGLGLAAELRTIADVTVVERIPVTGGAAGWSGRAVRRLTDELVADGVRFELGQTALRWDGHRLTVTGPGSFTRHIGDHLFVAGGLRPATLSDLGVDGDRPAGVLPATVAEHLLHAGVKLWDRVVILGDGQWAKPVAAQARRLGSEVLAVPADGRRHRIVGDDRVRALRWYRDDEEHEIACDAVVLAADPRPNRNIEGALAGSDSVTCHQPVAPQRFDQRVTAARDAARQWITTQKVAT
jgi:NADPH-dependent 2,4-dienoyl-CoA reductase/sulfur reductase-like enzyme